MVNPKYHSKCPIKEIPYSIAMNVEKYVIEKKTEI